MTKEELKLIRLDSFLRSIRERFRPLHEALHPIDQSEWISTIESWRGTDISSFNGPESLFLELPKETQDLIIQEQKK